MNGDRGKKRLGSIKSREKTISLVPRCTSCSVVLRSAKTTHPLKLGEALRVFVGICLVG